MMLSPETTVAILETAISLAGLGFFGWVLMSPAGRAARKRPPRLPPWEISRIDFFFFLWLVLGLAFFGQLLMQVLAGDWLRSQREGKVLEIIAYGSVFHFGAILAWVVVQALMPRRSHSAGATPLPRAAAGHAVVRGILTFVVAVPLALGAGALGVYLLERAGLPVERQELIDLFAEVRSPALLAFMAALALVVAPISEELVFRAGLFRYLRTRLPRWAAYLLSAGLFALLHTNWPSFPPLFVLGLIFALAYERTGSIAVPMIAHALFNLNTLLLVLGGVGG